jgi:hypothetical protein
MSCFIHKCHKIKVSKDILFNHIQSVKAWALEVITIQMKDHDYNIFFYMCVTFSVLSIVVLGWWAQSWHPT